MVKLSVVIVNYNVKHFVEQCLDSLYKALVGVECELFVVDNHSHDGSVEYLAERFPGVNLIESIHNQGFARANNLAIRQASGQYVLLINPDTFVGEHVIVEALTFMDDHPKAGGVGVQMHNADGSLAMESRRGLPTPTVSLLKMLGRSDRYYMSHLPWDQPARIEVISGAFCLLRKQALDQIGLLDEDFFMYGEDIDLSYRLLKGGWENWYLPLPIVHYKGESTQKTSFRYVHVFYQAMLIFFRKHYGHLSLFVTLPIKAAIYLRALMALVQMQYWRMRKSLGFVDRRSEQPVYSFRGSEPMVEECRKLAKRKGLVEGDRENACVVFDTDAYSYERIIRDMEAAAAGKRLLGTYSCRTKVLITPKEVIL